MPPIPPSGQLGLFGADDPPPDPRQRAGSGRASRAVASALDGDPARRQRLEAVASHLPPTLRLGTSSWSFPGWSGLVWDRPAPAATLARAGLAAYSRHPLLRTVGLDRAFYAPLSRAQYADLAAQTPDGFRFLVKAHQALTRPDADQRGHTFGDTAALRHLAAQGRGGPNPLFLDARYALDIVVGPALEGLADRCGPIVVQFPPMDLGERAASTHAGPPRLPDAAARFLDALDAFLDRLGPLAAATAPGAFIAIEVRSASLLTPGSPALSRYAALLRRARAAHAYAGHPALPPIRAQQAALAAAGWPVEAGPGAVCRWLLRPDQTYDGARARYEPFDRVIDDDPSARDDVAALVHAALPVPAGVYVIVNNKAEGSAPLSIERLARAIVEPGGSPPPEGGLAV